MWSIFTYEFTFISQLKIFLQRRDTLQMRTLRKIKYDVEKRLSEEIYKTKFVDTKNVKKKQVASYEAGMLAAAKHKLRVNTLARHLCAQDGHLADAIVYKTNTFQYNTPNGPVHYLPIDSHPIWWHYTDIAEHAINFLKPTTKPATRRVAQR